MTTRRRTRPLAVLAAGCLAAWAGPAAAERTARTMLEVTIGATLPAASATYDTSPWDGFDTDFAHWLEPAFIGGLHFGWLPPVGDGPACCYLGPEVGFEYIAWEPASEYSETVTALRLRFPVGARLMAVWDWGYLFARFGFGPEMVEATTTGFIESPGHVGATFFAGGGIGWLPFEFFGMALLTDLVADWHRGNDDSSYGYFNYDAFEVDVRAAFTFFL